MQIMNTVGKNDDVCALRDGVRKSASKLKVLQSKKNYKNFVKVNQYLIS